MILFVLAVAGESANLYMPSTELDDVVLPEVVSSRLLTLLDSAAALRAYSRASKLAEAIPQPEGLVLLLCGPSGSGKTMTANAIAKRLGKRVLLVNFPSICTVGSSNPHDQHYLVCIVCSSIT